jgi:hypothetical protein
MVAGANMKPPTGEKAAVCVLWRLNVVVFVGLVLLLRGVLLVARSAQQAGAVLSPVGVCVGVLLVARSA